MPIFEFECKTCHHRFERLMLSSDKDNPACPNCESVETRKLMSACSNVNHKISGGYSGAARSSACAPTG